MKKLLSFALSSLCLTFAYLIPQSVQAEDTAVGHLDNLAFQMTGEIMALQGKKKLAIRPFIKGQTPLDSVSADRLYDKLHQSFQKISLMGGIQLVDRRHILELLQSREEFYMGKPEALLQNMQADIEIICHPQPLVKTLRLSCIAGSLTTGVTFSTRETEISFNSKAVGAVTDTAMIETLASRLSLSMNDMKLLLDPVFIDQQSGRQTEVTDMLAKRLKAGLTERILKEQARQQADYEANLQINEATQPPPAPYAEYSLRGDLRHISDEIQELHLTLKKSGQPVAAETGRFLSDSLPENLQRPPVLQNVEKLYQATGKARISRYLDEEAAKRAALNLARARILAQAALLPAPAFDMIQSEADASLVLLHLLKEAIPVEERLLKQEREGHVIIVELQAKARHIGTSLKPDLQARLSKSSYQSGEEILLALQASGQVEIGIFGWFADGQIVRIYPNDNRQSLTLRGGQPKTLPEPFEDALASAPMPFNGNIEDQESFLILASSNGFDFKSLAPLLGQSAGQSAQYARSSQDFFNDLAGRDMSNLSLTILPYQIRN